MKIEAYCTKIVERPYTSPKTGITTRYFDATWMDAEANPMNRFPGLVFTKPTEEEVKTFHIAEGSRLTLNVLKVVELRNGDPLVTPRYEVPAKKA